MCSFVEGFVESVCRFQRITFMIDRNLESILFYRLKCSVV